MISYNVFNLHNTFTFVGDENRLPLRDQMIVSVATICTPTLLTLPVRHIDIMSPLKQGGIENNHTIDNMLHQFANTHWMI